MNPFDYVNDILGKQADIMKDDPLAEKDYVPFLTNRGLSYVYGAVWHANEMNQRPQLDKKLQYHYLINIVKPMRGKRESWAKKVGSSDIDAVMEYYSYSYKNAKDVVSLLSKEQLKHIKTVLEKGGLKK